MEVRVQADPATQAMRAALTPATVRKAQGKALRGWVVGFLAEIKTRGPGSRPGNTGNYRRGWNGYVFEDRGAVLYNPVRYAGFIEFGTKPHEIRPKGRKALRWRTGGRGAISAYRVGKAGGSENFTFARIVRHPGTAPQQVFRGAWERQAPALANGLATAIGDAFSGR